MAMKDQLGFQGCPETLYGGVVVAVPGSAHGGLHPETFEQPPILQGALLTALVRVMQKANGRVGGLYRPQQRLRHQVPAHAPSHGVADDFPGAQVLVPNQVQPTFIGGNIGHIAQPGPQRRLGLKPLLEQVLSHWQAVPGRRDLEFTPLLASQPKLATKTLDAVHPDAHPVSGQIPLQPLRAVSLPRA